MSAKLMGQVYEHEFTHGEQSILLALADHAQDDGSNIFPSIPYIAWKTNYSSRQVQRTIQGLVKRGVLVVIRQARAQRPTEYRMDLSKAPKKAPFRGTIGAEFSDDGEDRGDMMTDVTMSGVTPRQVTSDVERGDIYDTRGDIAMSPEPSVNHQLEPSYLARDSAGDSKVDTERLKEGKPKNPRPRDLLFEAVAVGFGFATNGDGLTRSARGAMNQAVKEIREAGGEPGQVPSALAAYRKRYPGAACTPRALASHWPFLIQTPATIPRTQVYEGHQEFPDPLRMRPGDEEDGDDNQRRRPA